jgi:hypothetical protein
MQNISRNYKSSSIDVTFKWENISKEKLYTALGENNMRGEPVIERQYRDLLIVDLVS